MSDLNEARPEGPYADGKTVEERLDQCEAYIRELIRVVRVLDGTAMASVEAMRSLTQAMTAASDFSVKLSSRVNEIEEELADIALRD